MSSILGWIETVPAYRVVELTRRAPGLPETTADPARPQRMAAVVAAFHTALATGAEGGRLMLGWCRSDIHGPVHVFTAGAHQGRPDADNRAALGLPPGGVGVGYDSGALLTELRSLPHWTSITGITDGLLSSDETFHAADLRPSLDDCLMRVWREPFGWVLVAEAVTAPEIADAARAVAYEQREAQAKASSPDQAVLAERLGRRHRELRQGESTGMWRIQLIAGGMTPAGAAAVSGLICASADLDRLPYALAPGRRSGTIDEMLSPDPAGSAFIGSSLLVASLAVSPVQEVPGVRLAMRSEFDVTPETDTGPPTSRAVTAGTVLDHNGSPGQGLRIPYSSLNRHTFVCGATGAGKSQTVRHLLEEATAGGLPWLVVEPAKAEYRQMADRIGGENVITIRPGDPDALPAGFNPLEPAPGFALQTHADLVRSLFLAAFEADEPFPQVLSAALTRCYEDQGWDLAIGEPKIPGHRPRYPTLGDLQQTAERVVDEIGYGKEVTDNVRGFIRVRLSSLRLGTTGRFFEGGHPLSIPALLDRNVVFEIEDVGDDRDKAFLMGALLIQLVEHRRIEIRRKPELSRAGLRHISVFEEAHRLLRRSEVPGPTTHAVEMFASLLAEIRAYGEGLVIAEQIPSKLIPDVIKNTAVKIMHRLPALDDRTAVGATVNLTERQSEYLVTLPAGTGAAFSDGMDQPILIRMPDGSGRERGGETPTATPRDIIGRRSATCGQECRSAACTLRDMRAAQHFLADHPWVVLWAELAVLGHLTGWPTPALKADYLVTLWSLPARTRECALSHAVDEAVAVRAAVLAAGCDPTELARHVLGSMESRLTGQEFCVGEESFYLARPYRWQHVFDILTTAELTVPHPRTAEWAVTYGRRIDASTTIAQAEIVGGWLNSDQRSQADLRMVRFGGRSPGALQAAVGASFGDDDWARRLTEQQQEYFTGVPWPVRILAPVATDG